MDRIKDEKERRETSQRNRIYSFIAKDIQVPSLEFKKKVTDTLLNTYFMLEIKPSINICMMFSVSLK